MQHLTTFPQTLLRRLHAGQLPDLVRGRAAQCVWAIQRTYTITATAQAITIRARDRELIRTRRRGRWRRLVTTTLDQGRLILDRRSGAVQCIGNGTAIPRHHSPGGTS